MITGDFPPPREQSRKQAGIDVGTVVNAAMEAAEGPR
jgi:hypothetical protein